MGIEVFKKHIREKRAIKVSLGSLNIDNIEYFCRSAQEARVSAIDIPADKNIFKIVKNATKLPVFVSSIHPFKLRDAVEWGVDAILIGNFVKKYTSSEIYNIVVETLSLINDFDVYVCVSIPSYFENNERIELIQKLNILGVDLIQSDVSEKQVINSLFEKTYLPYMISYNSKHADYHTAIENGASAINVVFEAQDTQVALKMKMMSLVGMLSYRNSIHKEILRTKSDYVLS